MKMTLDEILEVIHSNRSIIKSLGVRSLGIFGSYATGRVQRLSDIDFIVEFDTKTFDNYMDLKLFLEQLFGRNIDVVIADSIKPRLRHAVLKSVIYAERL